jgi:hypothetical protein
MPAAVDSAQLQQTFEEAAEGVAGLENQMQEKEVLVRTMCDAIKDALSNTKTYQQKMASLKTLAPSSADQPQFNPSRYQGQIRRLFYARHREYIVSLSSQVADAQKKGRKLKAELDSANIDNQNQREDIDKLAKQLDEKKRNIIELEMEFAKAEQDRIHERHQFTVAAQENQNQREDL